MTSFVIAPILEKTENRFDRKNEKGIDHNRKLLLVPRSRDKDFRYMATSDLLVELQKPAFKPDSDGERKICKCILKLLNDQSSDVQGLAVKWHAHAITTPTTTCVVCAAPYAVITCSFRGCLMRQSVCTLMFSSFSLPVLS